MILYFAFLRVNSFVVYWQTRLRYALAHGVRYGHGRDVYDSGVRDAREQRLNPLND